MELRETIRMKANEAVERWFAANFDRMFDDVMQKEVLANVQVSGQLNRVQFVWQMAFEFIRAGSPGAVDARDMAVTTLRDFLNDDGIKFGDPGYDWSQSGAVTLARECQIDYWEAA